MEKIRKSQNEKEINLDFIFIFMLKQYCKIFSNRIRVVNDFNVCNLNLLACIVFPILNLYKNFFK